MNTYSSIQTSATALPASRRNTPIATPLPYGAAGSYRRYELLGAEEYAIHAEDKLFVSASQYGKSLLTGISLSGFTSIEELYGAVKKLLDGVQGMVTLNIRNRTHGWSRNASIRFARTGMSMLATA